MSKGVPWDQAWEMEPGRRRACCIFYGQLAGGTYDFESMRWEKKT